MAYIIEHATELMAIVAGIISVASLIANLTPTETDNKVVGALSKLVDFLALNFKK